MKTKVVLKSCETYELKMLEEAIALVLSLAGGLSAFFKQGESVLLKPNLLTDTEPQSGITTHPNFVQAVVRVFKKAGLEVCIADIPGEYRLEANLERVYNRTGMLEVSKREEVRLLTSPRFIEEDGVIFSSWVREFDHLVSLPKFKTHSLMTLTGAVKNIFGLTPRLYRIALHKQGVRPDDFAKMLIGVYKKCKPTLSLLDGIVAMEGNGPAYGGTLRHLGLIATSSDAFALDSVLAYLIGLKPCDILTNREGRLENLGITDLAQIELVGDELKNFKKDDFKIPPKRLMTQLPKGILNELVQRFAEFRPRVDRASCNGCSVCIENCPISAIRLKDKKAEIDYQMCVDCFCCLEVCPKGAMKTKSGPLIHILRVRDQVARAMAGVFNKE